MHFCSMLSQIAEHEPRFDLLVNDEWSKRHMVIQKFVQAGRKVKDDSICHHSSRQLHLGRLIFLLCIIFPSNLMEAPGRL